MRRRAEEKSLAQSFAVSFLGTCLSMPRQRALSDFEIVSDCVSIFFIRLNLMGGGMEEWGPPQVGRVAGERRWEERGGSCPFLALVNEIRKIGLG